ncbi:hypothetical protein [Streptomyces minutiscleroticus]|uniref:Uncharacterized protein n=1 Tax=Streptomyces minutiscleroticus TaxID=68238 RepID=A0A918K5H3_9ACTN|nr:hypothetical protein [Streptomyces minutiscleroticus]GGX51038.1 hypothetical protein GCM10010358_00740 [Streptomyces minutiscleroticus]
MADEKEHWNAVLAEILLSKKVGVTHIRLVGDLISAQAQLSMGMQGRAGLSLAERADIAEELLMLEDAYRTAWQAVVAATDIDQRVAELHRLTTALSDAVEGVTVVARRYGIRSEPRRLDGER